MLVNKVTLRVEMTDGGVEELYYEADYFKDEHALFDDVIKDVNAKKQALDKGERIEGAGLPQLDIVDELEKAKAK